MILELPFPPSLNSYYRTVRGRILISKKGRQYRNDVVILAKTNKTLLGRLSVSIILFPPDKRRRDLDNNFKAILDALAYAGIYKDDSQKDQISMVRSSNVKNGSLLIDIKEI